MLLLLVVGCLVKNKVMGSCNRFRCEWNRGDLELSVPGLFFDEVLNVLLKAINTGRISESSYRSAWGQLLSLITYIQVYQHSISVEAIISKEALARKHNLRSYDTNYLLLALETGSRLATLDDRLTRAARLEGCYYEPL